MTPDFDPVNTNIDLYQDAMHGTHYEMVRHKPRFRIFKQADYTRQHIVIQPIYPLIPADEN